jgi:hypothetical protein
MAPIIYDAIQSCIIRIERKMLFYQQRYVVLLFANLCKY